MPVNCYYYYQKSYESVCRQIRRPNQAVTVQFKVGDVIRHRRYHYRGVIYGWDAECKAEEDWMQQMRIDQLPGMPLRQFWHLNSPYTPPLTCLQPVSQGRNL